MGEQKESSSLGTGEELTTPTNEGWKRLEMKFSVLTITYTGLGILVTKWICLMTKIDRKADYKLRVPGKIMEPARASTRIKEGKK